MKKEYQTMKEMLEQIAANYKDKIAFIDIDEQDQLVEITYGKLKEDLDAFGTGMRALGLDQNKIIILGRNRYHWALAYLTSAGTNGLTVPLDKELPDNEIQNCINRVEADTIIYSGEFETRLKKMREQLCIKHYISMDQASNLTIEKIIEVGKKELANGNRNYIDQPIDENKVFELLFTSGTTSASKIVMLTQKNIMSNVIEATKQIQIQKKDVLLSVLPLHHTLENTCGLIAPLTKGATIGYNDSFKNLSKNMKRIQPTIMIVVPRFLELLNQKIERTIEKKQQTAKFEKTAKAATILRFPDQLKKRIFQPIHQPIGGRLRFLFVGGAASNPKNIRYMNQLGIRVLEGYGLTECSPIVALNTVKKVKIGSVGQVIPKTVVKIHQPDQDGVGEILVKGPGVFQGYYQNEEATKFVMTKDGFFHTGDLGSFDKKHFLTIKGRTKNMILGSNGENIYPEDLEFLLNQNSIIRESLLHAENEGTKSVKLTAEIVLSEKIIEQIKKHPEYEEEIKEVIKKYIDEVNSQLPAYKRISQFFLWTEEFQKNTTLKIQRQKVLEKKQKEK